MAIYLSAGHHNHDSGAIGVNGRQENKETIRLRDRILHNIKPGYRVITDKDPETLAQYLRRIGPGDGSVVLELHFDSYNDIASGATALYMTGAPKNSVIFAAELSQFVATTLGIPNRGAKSETESARGRLGLVHKEGITALLEVCFIDNANDIASYDAHFDELSKGIAQILMKYDDLIR